MAAEAAAAVPQAPPKPTKSKPRAESPTTTLNNLINLTKQNNATTVNKTKNFEKLESSSTGLNKQPEVILIDKDKEDSVQLRQQQALPVPHLEPILKVQSQQRQQAVFATSNK